MNNRVYMLSYYQEHGAEGCRITDDPLLVPTIFDEMTVHHPNEEKRMKMRKRLKRLLENDDTSADVGDDLGDDWGGPQLHIMYLES